MLKKKIKILVCDDSIVSRERIIDDLESFEIDMEIFTAKDGLDAVEKYKEINPDIVFIDLIMPKADGAESVELIIDYDEDAVIIVVTSLGHSENIKKVTDAGAKGLIQKPWNKAQLLKKLIEHLDYSKNKNSMNSNRKVKKVVKSRKKTPEERE